MVSSYRKGSLVNGVQKYERICNETHETFSIVEIDERISQLEKEVEILKKKKQDCFALG